MRWLAWWQTPTRAALALVAMIDLLVMSHGAQAGPATQLVAYVQNNVVTDLETLAIIGLGVIMFMANVRWFLVVGICAGIWIMANPTTIRAAIGG